MNKYAIAALSFTAGAIIGFTIGHFVIIEKDEHEDRVTADDIRKKPEEVKVPVQKEEEKIDPAETESPQDDDPSKLVSSGPAHIAMPGQNGVNYAKVQKIIKENGYTTEEEIQQVINDPDNEETYEERVEREEIEESKAMAEYRKKNKGKIAPIQKDEYESDFLDVDYDKQELYYFTVDDVLTDENGNVVNEEEYIGERPRKFGWMANDEERIYIRNHPKETDYLVWKQKCQSSDWWG